MRAHTIAENSENKKRQKKDKNRQRKKKGKEHKAEQKRIDDTARAGVCRSLKRKAWNTKIVHLFLMLNQKPLTRVKRVRG